MNSVYRSDLLDSRVKALINSGKKISRADVVKAMEDAAVTDLRGEDVLPDILQVINSQPVTDATQARAGQRADILAAVGVEDRGVLAGQPEVRQRGPIQLMDAWWPLLVQAEFTPGMGQNLFNAMIGAIQINESPSGGQTGPSTGPVDANESITPQGIVVPVRLVGLRRQGPARRCSATTCRARWPRSTAVAATSARAGRRC